MANVLSRTGRAFSRWATNDVGGYDRRKRYDRDEGDEESGHERFCGPHEFIRGKHQRLAL